MDGAHWQAKGDVSAALRQHDSLPTGTRINMEAGRLRDWLTTARHDGRGHALVTRMLTHLGSLVGHTPRFDGENIAPGGVVVTDNADRRSTGRRFAFTPP